MDKNTLSHYGWVVICIIIIAILLGLATPFGNYVYDSVINTTRSFGEKVSASLGFSNDNSDDEDGGSGTHKALDYTVTFVVDGEPYMISHVKEGMEVYVPSVDPVKDGQVFTGWKLGNEYGNFPYIPTEDVTFDAHFQAVREEMELYNAGDFLTEDAAGNITTKVNDGWCIAGYIPASKNDYIFLVAKTADACYIDGYAYKGPFTYNDIQYYFCCKKMSTTDTAVRKCNDVNFTSIGSVVNNTKTAMDILDKYFYVT